MVLKFIIHCDIFSFKKIYLYNIFYDRFFNFFFLWAGDKGGLDLGPNFRIWDGFVLQKYCQPVFSDHDNV